MSVREAERERKFRFSSLLGRNSQSQSEKTTSDQKKTSRIVM